MRTLLLILAFSVGALIAIFGFQNTELVRLQFLGWSTDSAPLALIILVSALVGALLAFILSLRAHVRHTLKLRQQSRRIRHLETTGASETTEPGHTDSA